MSCHFEQPVENALARQFVVLTEKSEWWEPLPKSFDGPKWLEMPNANATMFFKICQCNSGANSTVILAQDPSVESNFVTIRSKVCHFGGDC
jgi:hypothetical protein